MVNALVRQNENVGVRHAERVWVIALASVVERKKEKVYVQKIYYHDSKKNVFEFVASFLTL
jgi:hypothetical protein